MSTILLTLHSTMSFNNVSRETYKTSNIMKYKCQGKLKRTKTFKNPEGVNIGVTEGYILTFDKDRGQDIIVKGAFLDSINELKRRKRQLRFKYEHSELVGGFPSDSIVEDDKGVYAIGHVNLDVTLGSDVFNLAKQKVLVDYSIGYSVEDSDSLPNGGELIKVGTLWEASIVSEPMNPNAQIEQVKSWNVRDIEKQLRRIMTNRAAKMLASRLKYETNPDIDNDDSELLKFIKSIRDLNPNRL